jgi:hypothetical protein
VCARATVSRPLYLDPNRSLIGWWVYVLFWEGWIVVGWLCATFTLFEFVVVVGGKVLSNQIS